MRAAFQLNETFYESTLTILQVDQYNYGDYVCTASNKLGRTTSVNRLTVFSHPDPPYNFRLANVTHNKVMLTWTPGFDGGNYYRLMTYLYIGTYNDIRRRRRRPWCTRPSSNANACDYRFRRFILFFFRFSSVSDANNNGVNININTNRNFQIIVERFLFVRVRFLLVRFSFACGTYTTVYTRLPRLYARHVYSAV